VGQPSWQLIPRSNYHESVLGRGLTAVLVAAALGLAATPAGALNPVQRENARPGDKAWRAYTSVAPASAIEGYTSATSVLPGSGMTFMVKAPGTRYRIEISRLGWYGGKGGRRIACIPGCTKDRPGVAQPGTPSPDPTTGRVAAGWAATDSLTVPNDWPSGYYIAVFRLTTGPDAGAGRWFPFIVRPRPGRTPRVLVQVPVLTWQAYNNWGGKSAYAFNSTGRQAATKVSFNRPLAFRSGVAYNSPVFSREYRYVRFLERRGYDVGYVADTDVDANPGLLLRSRVDMTVGHSEYWTKAMRDGWELARAGGRNLVFGGGDTGVWQVRLEDDRHTIVIYRTSAQDPETDPRLETVQFRKLKPPRPPCALAGVEYLNEEHNGVHAYLGGTDLAGHPWAQGTALGAGTSMAGLVGYEWDRIVPGCLSYSLKRIFHYDGGPDANGDSDAVSYTTESGSQVFSAGSMEFSRGLDSYGSGRVNTDLQAFVTNMLGSMGAAPFEPLLRLRAPAYASDTSRSRRFRVRWKATASGVGAATFRLQARRRNVRSKRWHTVAVTTRGGASFRGRPGATYDFRLRAEDRYGNRSHFARGATVVPLDDRSRLLRFSGGWRRESERSAWAGTLMRAREKGHAVALRFRGTRVAVIAPRSLVGGRFVAKVGRSRRIVSLRSRHRRGARKVVYRSPRLGRRRHTLRITTLSGGPVQLDAVAVTP
jgi:hypothetical protein